MDTLQHLMTGLAAAMSLQNLAFALIGCTLGTLIGVLPGLGPAAGTAILIPLTFKLDPTGALIMLSAIYYGAMYGGTITSVLINVPGEAASVVTCFDGHEMAKQGRGGTALGIAAIGSFVGGIFATIALIVVAPPLARFALSFGPPEFFALMLVGLCLVTGLAGRSLLAGIVMAVLGLLIAMVGIDPVRGAPRFTFGIPSLYDGVGFIPVVMGLFGVAEILLTVERPYREVIKTNLASLLPSREEWRRCVGAIARGTGIGFFLGLIPGVGAIIPTFIAYIVEKRISKTPERFGQGAIEGVAAPETANNAYANAAMIPAADARHPELAHHRRADGRLHRQRPHARTLPFQGAARSRVGGDRELPARQRAAADPQSAAGGTVGAAPAPALPVCLRRHAALLHHRRLQPAAERVRYRRDDRVRHHRLRHAQDRHADRAPGARLDSRAVPREIAAHLARDVGRRLLDLPHPAAVPRAAGDLSRRPRRLGAAPGAGRGARDEVRRRQATQGGMNMLRRITAAIGAASMLMTVAGGAVAQDYPNRPIQLMVAFPPGGSTDIGARIVAAIAEKALGQSITVVNKGGAGGQVGWTDMVRQKPDGYYIGFINLPATNTVILDPERKAIFTEKDFTPIINQVLDPGVIWVRADSPYKTMQDLIEAAKKAPSTIRAATTGILSDDHLAILMTEEAAPGAIFRIVHLDGGATQFKEIMAGNIDAAFDNVGSIVPRVKSGEVRALAVMDEARSKFLPDVPTTKEAGYPTVISSSTRGIAGPKDMPRRDRQQAARCAAEGHG